MGSVGSAECIIHINIRAFTKFACKIFIPLGLLFIETKVFKKKDLSRFE